MSVVGQAEGIEHGTIRGYRQHRYRQVEMCGPCRDADLRDQVGRRAGLSPEARQAAEAPTQMSSARRNGKSAPPASMPRMYIRPYSPHPPGWQDPAWGVPITGAELAVGDVIVHLGRHYTVDRFGAYDGSLDLGQGARIAHSGTWGLPIADDRTVRILPREGS